MKLSLVICCYNEEKYLESHFNSILAQDEFPDELIFVNNASTDRSKELALAFKSKFEALNIKFIYLEELKKGVVYARTRGYEQAQGELVGSVDVDQQLNPYWVRNVKKAFSSAPATIAISGPVFFTNLPFQRKVRFLSLYFFNYLLFKIRYIVWGGNAVYKKTALSKVNYLNGYVSAKHNLQLKYEFEDAFLTFKLKQLGNLKFVWGLWAIGEYRVSAERDAEHKNHWQKLIRYFARKPVQQRS